MRRIPQIKLRYANRVRAIVLEDVTERLWWTLWLVKRSKRYLVSRILKDRHTGIVGETSRRLAPAWMESLPAGEVIAYEIEYPDGVDCSNIHRRFSSDNHSRA